MKHHALSRRYGRRKFGHFGGRGEVVTSRRWRKNTGATASIYGAVPWTGAPGNRQEDWHMEDVGWTIQWADGTVGIGKQPFDTKGDAETWLKKHEARMHEASKYWKK